MRAALTGPAWGQGAPEPGSLAAAEALVALARGFGGLTLGELAARCELPLPAVAVRAKGYVGKLIERALGVVPRSSAWTDFPSCELKSLPVTAAGRPSESTFVCCVALQSLAEIPWELSRVRAKLERVLFVPVESQSAGLPLAARRVGSAFLWRMSASEEAVLRADYEAAAERAAAGQLEFVPARAGVALQLRPKAAHAGIRVRAHTADGAPLRVHPRAFYLRAGFTHGILRQEQLVVRG